MTVPKQEPGKVALNTGLCPAFRNLAREAGLAPEAKVTR